jgi:hydroxymethylpyrimidine/phosphomethylpyrimidine kinase
MTARRPAATRPRSALTIAGADSGGGAGIAADLRVFGHYGLHGLAAITAVTAQNTREVVSIHPVPAATVVAQVDAVLADFEVAAIKTGMLASRSIVEAIAARLGTCPGIPLVVDPVLRAGTGRRLLDPRSLSALRSRLFPRATLVTPNLPELAMLSGLAIAGEPSLRAAVRRLHGDGATAILVKGGHASGSRVTDRLFVDGVETRRWVHRRRRLATHGTGCTLAAAVASGLALGSPLESAIDAAVALIQDCLANPVRPSPSGTCLMVPSGK